MADRIKQTGSYPVVSADGKRHTLLKFTKFLGVASRDGTEYVEGLSSLQIETGLHVNRISQGKYEVVTTGEELASDDPHAP